MQYFTGNEINTEDILGSATFSGNSKNRGNVRFAYFTENSSHEEGNIDRAIFSNNSFLDIESGKCRTPAKTIHTTASNRLIVNSTNNATLSCNVVGNITFTGNASLANGYSHTFA